jgi:hypothetical protein
MQWIMELTQTNEWSLKKPCNRENRPINFGFKGKKQQTGRDMGYADKVTGW